MATKRLPLPEVTEFEPVSDLRNPNVTRYRTQAPVAAEPLRNPNVSPERISELRAQRAAPAPNLPATAAPAPTANLPAATSAPAAQPPTTLRQRGYAAGQAVRQRLAARPTAPTAGVGAAALTGVMSAADSFGRDTEDYYRRLGMDTNDRSLLRDLGARSVGVVSDLGAAILDTPLNTVNAVRTAARAEPLELPGGSFTDILRRNDRPAEAPAPTVAPANSGIRTQNVVEGLNTRGMTPGMPGPGRVLQNNFDPELAKLPAELPGGLRQGVVHRTLDANGRPIYSGSNVGVNPQFVDGAGKTVTPRGFTGEIPGMSPSLRGPVAGSGSPVAAVEPGVQGGGMAGFGPTAAERDLSNRRRAADFAAQSRDRRTRERGMRELDALDRAELAQSQSEASLRGAEIQAGASRYGADRRLEGDALQAEATVGAANLRGRQASAAAQVERQAQTLAMQLANGDRRAAARILDSMGFSGAKLLSSEASEQGLQVKNREDSEALLKSLSAGADGKIDPARLARNQAVANDITGGQWSTMTPEERVQAQTKVTRAVKLLDGLNERRNAGFLKAIGFDQSSLNFASLPDMQGAVVDRLSVGRPGSVERGDYRIRTKAGEEFLVPASALDEGTKAMLQEDFGIKFKE